MGSRLRLLPGWPVVAALLLPVLAAGGGLLAAMLFTGPAGASPPAPSLAAPALPAAVALPPVPGLLVQVSGAVLHPGLYRLAKGDRVYAAVAAAGGLAADADPQRLPDLAGRLRDGEQVRVPALRKPGRPSGANTTVDLNGATLEELQTVPGISPALAGEIVDYRTQYGGFGSSRELVTVLGMGEADYLVAKRYVHV